MGDASMHLYFVGAEGVDFIKVGRSKNPARRVGQLRTQCPYKLRLLRTYEGRGDLEPYILHLLRQRMPLNGEWFLGTAIDCDALVDEAASQQQEAGPLSPSARLGQAIIRARQGKGWSQADLVAATGLSQKYVSEIENGHVDPRFSIVQRIAKVLGVSLDQLGKE
jgi:DNA-binding XRE family transcriptional regulator